MCVEYTSIALGIGGGTCSGKSTLALALQDVLGSGHCTVLSMDSYYYYPNPYLLKQGKANFEHPSAINLPLLNLHLEELLKGNLINAPIYERRTSKNIGTQSLSAAELVIVEGLFALSDAALCRQLTCKVYLDVDSDLRLARRLLRDVLEHGLDLNEACNNYLENTRRMHTEFIEPSKEYANIILSGPISIKEEVDIILKYLRNISS